MTMMNTTQTRLVPAADVVAAEDVDEAGDRDPDPGEPGEEDDDRPEDFPELIVGRYEHVLPPTSSSLAILYPPSSTFCCDIAYSDSQVCSGMTAVLRDAPVIPAGGPARPAQLATGRTRTDAERDLDLLGDRLAELIGAGGCPRAHSAGARNGASLVRPPVCRA